MPEIRPERVERVPEILSERVPERRELVAHKSHILTETTNRNNSPDADTEYDEESPRIAKPKIESYKKVDVPFLPI